MPLRLTGKMPASLPGFLLALCMGSLGGYVFNLFSVPLAWMLGSMSACTLASILRAPIAPYEPVRPYTTAVIGVLLGSSFTMAVFREVGEISISIVIMIVYLVFCTFIGTNYFIRIGKFDRVTAFFAAMPGGLAEMVTLGRANGGDANLIALVHSARILLVVASLPYVLMLLSNGGAGEFVTIQRNVRFASIEPTSVVWIVLCGLAGALLGRWLNLPARYLLGPMLLSGLVHISGISNFQIPAHIVVIAQVMLGTLIGCRFHGTPPARILKVLMYSAGLVAVLLAVLVSVVKLTRHLAIGGPDLLVLAYSPGGMTEMSLVALSMHVNVAFVSVHHIARIALIVILASVVSRWLKARNSRSGG